MFEKYDKLVDDWLKKNPELINGVRTDEDVQHLKNMCVSMLLSRDNILEGGSFVEAVVNNDLRGAVGRADRINIQNLPLYVTLLTSVGSPKTDNNE